MKKEINIVNNVLFTEFKNDCKVLSFAKEYPGYVGNEKYMILTDLSKEELIRKYGALLKNYEPYLIESMRLYSPIADYKKNEDKFEKRNARNTISIEVDVDDEQTITSLQVQDVLTASLNDSLNEELHNAIRQALKTLTNNQRRRLVMWALEGKTMSEIAELEGVSKQMIWLSIQEAKNKLKKYFKKAFTFAIPLSKGDEGTIDNGKQ